MKYTQYCLMHVFLSKVYVLHQHVCELRFALVKRKSVVHAV
jgi:hypothetical protein